MRIVFHLFAVLLLHVIVAYSKEALKNEATSVCLPGTKEVKKSDAREGATKECIPITDHDVISSLHWIAHPPQTKKCAKLKSFNNISYCEDTLIPSTNTAESSTKRCTVWSIIVTNKCDEIGNLDFEKHLSAQCDVLVFHFHTFYKGNVCNLIPLGKQADYPHLEVLHLDVWAGRCFACLYNTVPLLRPIERPIDLLLVQRTTNDVFDGVQYTILSDLFTYKPQLVDSVKQILITASVNAITLVDNVGREAENAWNIWATREFLSQYASAHSSSQPGPYKIQPRQFAHVLEKAQLDPTIGFYYHALIKVSPEEAAKYELEHASWKQPESSQKVLRARVPAYCRIPEADRTTLDEDMQKWANIEVNVRCHPTRLAVPCVDSRPYRAFIPCEQEMLDNLAEDYAATKGLCDFTQQAAEIPMIQNVDAGAAEAFRKPMFTAESKKVRLAFLFTVYADAFHVKRLLARLYSPDHYYLIHIDPTGSKPSFEQAIRDEIAAKYAKFGNMFIAKSVPIVYGASTATLLLTQTMAWFRRETSGWNYFVPVTGSDYPLVPLPRLEQMLSYQSYKLNNPQPFVMGWTPGTSTHIFRLSMTHPDEFKSDLMQLSFKAVMDERGRPLGSNPMEYRASNFGPPVFCANQQNFYHLDNRRNKSAVRMDTMWLFPRDIYPGKGRAYENENKAYALPSFDNGWRVWMKSDPATTGIYDRETIEYIVDSDEGKKYYHFFKHMLLGSEEHYYVSLLYNNNRTRASVMSLSSQVVWNTWELGVWEQSPGFQTHTHFLSMKEFDIIRGFALRGMIFAR